MGKDAEHVFEAIGGVTGEVEEEVVGCVESNTGYEVLDSIVLFQGRSLVNGELIIAVLRRIGHGIGYQLGIIGIAGGFTFVSEFPAGFYFISNRADRSGDEVKVFLTVGGINIDDPTLDGNKLAYEACKVNAVRNAADYEALRVGIRGHIINTVFFGKSTIIHGPEVAVAVLAIAVIDIVLVLVNSDRRGFGIKSNRRNIDISTAELVGLLDTGKGEDAIIETFGIHINLAFTIGNNGLRLIGRNGGNVINRHIGSVGHSNNGCKVCNLFRIRILEDFDILDRLLGSAVNNLHRSATISARSILRDGEQEVIYIGTSVGTYGNPILSFLGNLYSVSLVSGNGKREFTAIGRNVGCLNNSLQNSALEYQGADVRLAFMVGSINRNLNNSGIIILIGHLDNTGLVVDGGHFGFPSADDADNVNRSFVIITYTINGISKVNGSIEVYTIILVKSHIQREGLFLGERNILITHNQHNVVVGRTLFINVSGSEGAAVDFLEANHFPSFTTVVGNLKFALVVGTENRSFTVCTSSSGFTLLALLTLLTLRAGSGHRNTVGIVLVGKDLTVDGPNIDTVNQGDADYRSLAVGTVFTIGTSSTGLTGVTFITLVTFLTLLALLTLVTLGAILDGGGGAVGESDGVLTISFNDRNHGEFLVNGVNQVLETRDGFLIDFLHSLLKGGDPGIQTLYLGLEILQVGLLGAAGCEQRNKRYQQNSPNGFSHNT